MRKGNTKHKDKLTDGTFALGSACGVFISIFIYLVLDISHVGLTRTEILSVVPSLLTLLVALVSLLISFHALSEQRLMRQAGTDPVILIHLDKREDARIMSTLEVRNVGAGAAQNVKVTLLSDTSDYVPDRIITDFSKVSHPLRTIPQGHSVSYNFGLGHRLLEEPEIPPIEFEISYEDIEGQKRCSRQFVDVRELTMQRADEGLNSRIAKATERTAKALEGMQSIKPIKAVTQTKAEEEAANLALIESYKKEKE